MKRGFIKQVYLKEKPKKSLIIFLDRDGTINKEKKYLTKEKQIQIFQNAIKAFEVFNEIGCLIAVITNQPVIAWGWISEKKLEKINNIIFSRLKEKGGRIHAIYSCPHHPDATLENYRYECGCRKPGSLMFKEVSKDFGITLEDGWMVGDRTSDILAGKELGLRTILLRTGCGGSDLKYTVTSDFICRNLHQAALLIKSSIS